MAAAAAEVAGEPVAHLRLGRARVAIEQRLCGHDHAVEAVAALPGLLVDESLLQRMELGGGAQPLERGHLRLSDLADRRYAGARRHPVNQHGAGATLRQAATKFGRV